MNIAFQSHIETDDEEDSEEGSVAGAPPVKDNYHIAGAPVKDNYHIGEGFA